MAIAVMLGLVTIACKRDTETVAPEPEWTPDESAEPSAATASPEPAAPELSEEERKAQAKDLYVEAEAKAAAEDWSAAVGLYEQAYYLVPEKHGFALKVGIAAEKSGDCDKATTYYQHFVQYAEPDKYADDIAKAKKSLAKLEKGC